MNASHGTNRSSGTPRPCSGQRARPERRAVLGHHRSRNADAPRGSTGEPSAPPLARALRRRAEHPARAGSPGSRPVWNDRSSGTRQPPHELGRRARDAAQRLPAVGRSDFARPRRHAASRETAQPKNPLECSADRTPNSAQVKPSSRFAGLETRTTPLLSLPPPGRPDPRTRREG